MQFLQTIFNILMFLISLSLLVMIHELGHLASAKIFNVYCADFSIGFGKALFHKKRKNGETYFSLRTIPFGGYVAMADDEGETPDGTFVPKARTINGIKKWKSAIIMSSGVVMNLVLSILLLYVFYQFFPTDNLYYNVYNVTNDSPAALAGIRNYDVNDETKSDFAVVRYYYYDAEGLIYAAEEIEESNSEGNTPIVVSTTDFVFADSAILTKKNDESAEYYIVLDFTNVTLTNLKIDAETMVLRQKEDEDTDGRYKYVANSDIAGNNQSFLTDYKTLSIDAMFYGYDVDGIKTETVSKPIVLSIENGVIQSSGLSFYNFQTHSTFAQAWKKTFNSFANGSLLIFRSLGGLFTGKGWENVGGIIGIYSATSSTLNDMGFGYYLYYWGIISINLAIINLVPIPGLDGWHLLVIAFEGIFKKKIPDRAKTIVTYIGLAIMIALMVLLLIKDILSSIV